MSNGYNQSYGQINPNANYKLTRTRKHHTNMQNGSNPSVKGETYYIQQANNIMKKSTMTPTQRARAKVIRQQKQSQELGKRLAAMGLACLLAGGIGASAISAIKDKYDEHAMIYCQLNDFRHDVIEPNTHTNVDGKYWIDYDKISDAIFADGVDSSVELYKAYNSLGKTKTNNILEGTSSNTLEEFVEKKGYDSVKDWTKYCTNAILVEAQIEEKQAELKEMHDEFTEKKSGFDLKNLIGGSK